MGRRKKDRKVSAGNTKEASEAESPNSEQLIVDGAGAASPRVPRADTLKAEGGSGASEQPSRAESSSPAKRKNDREKSPNKGAKPSPSDDQSSKGAKPPSSDGQSTSSPSKAAVSAAGEAHSLPKSPSKQSRKKSESPKSSSAANTKAPSPTKAPDAKKTSPSKTNTKALSPPRPSSPMVSSKSPKSRSPEKKSPERRLSRRKSVGPDAEGVTSFEVPSVDESKDLVSKSLDRRKSVQELKEAGIIVAENVEEVEEQAKKKAELTEVVKRKFSDRPNLEEVEKSAQHIVDPVGLGRRASSNLAAAAKELEKNLTGDKIHRFLEHRPSKNDLQQLGVMRDGEVAPAIQEVQAKLQHELVKSTIGHKLESRPNFDELKDQGVVLDSNVAPSIQAVQQQLQKEMVKDKVVHLLEARPAPEELISQNILTPESVVAPSIQGARVDLQRNLMRDDLNRQLNARPTIEELTEQGLLGSLTPATASPTTDSQSPVIKSSSINSETQQNRKVALMSARAKYAIALKAVSKLFNQGAIDAKQRGHLKDLVLSDDLRVQSSLQVYEIDHDGKELLDTFYRLAVRAP